MLKLDTLHVGDMNMTTGNAQQQNSGRAQSAQNPNDVCPHEDQLSFFAQTPLEAILAGASSTDEVLPTLFN